MIVLPAQLREHRDVAARPARSRSRSDRPARRPARPGSGTRACGRARTADSRSRCAATVVPVDAVQRALQRLDAVGARVVGPRLHPRLVELHEVGAGGEQVERPLRAPRRRTRTPSRAGPRRTRSAACCGHRERPGDRDLDQPVGVRAQELDVAHQHRLAAADRPVHARRGSSGCRCGRGPFPACRRRRPRAPSRSSSSSDSRRASPSVMMSSPARSWSRIATRHGGILGVAQIGGVDAPQIGGADPRRQPTAKLLAVDQPVRYGSDPTRLVGVGPRVATASSCSV